MKKFVFLFAVSFLITGSCFAQLSLASACFQSYEGQLTKGYNALAVAVDNGFFVCGFSFGQYDKGTATRQAIDECEVKRLDPANDAQGQRKIMTHCRIHRFRLIE